MLITFYLSLLLLPYSLHAQVLYQVEDLEVLSRERNFSEFFDHMQDIKPSQRTDKWRKTVEETSALYADSLLLGEIITDGQFDQIEKLYAHPAIKEYEYFKLKRRAIALRYFKNCFRENAAPESPCWKKIYDFWDPNRQDQTITLDLMKMLDLYWPIPFTEENPNHLYRKKMSLWYLVSEPLKTPLAHKLISAPRIMDLVWDKLIDDYMRMRSIHLHLNTLIHPNAYPQLILEAKSILRKSTPSILKDIAFQILKSRSSLAKEDQDLYLTYYLLDSPVKGEIFNLAWNHLEQLKHKPADREAIKETLFKFKPLPAEILNSKDPLKQKAVLNLFNKNFPEYFDQYALTCIHYFKGIGRFPEGNPAIYCHELKIILKNGSKNISSQLEKLILELNI